MTHPLQRQVRCIGQQARVWLFAGALTSTVGIVVTSIFLVGLLDYLFVVRDIGIRIMGTASTLVAAGLALWRFLWPALHTPLDDVTVARNIESLLPRPQDQLSSAIDFLQQQENDPTAGSIQLRRAVIADMNSRCGQIELPKLADRRPAFRALAFLGIVSVPIAVACFVDGRSVVRSLRRFAVPWSAVGWNDLEPIDVPRQIAAGENFMLQVRDREERLPQNVQVQYWFDGDDLDEVLQEAMVRSGETAQHQLTGVYRSFRFRVVGGDDQSMPWHAVEVVEPPQLDELSIVLFPPAYTGWPPVTAEDALVALTGTRVAVRGSVTKSLSAAAVHVSVGDSETSFPAIISEDGMQFVMDEPADDAWTIHDAGYLDLELLGRDGIVSHSAARREIRAVVHRVPQVSLTRPATHQFVTPRALLSLEITVAEQIAIERVQIQVDRPDGSPPAESNIDIYVRPDRSATPRPDGWATDEPPATTFYADLDLTSLSSLRPGQRLEIRALASNGKPLEGQSESRRLNIVSDDELIDRLAPSERYIFHQLSKMIEQQRQARSRTAALEIGLSERQQVRSSNEDELQNAEFVQHQVHRFLRSSEDSVLPRLEWLLAQLEQNRLDRSDLRRTIQRFHQVLDDLGQSDLTRIEQEFVVLRRTARDLSFGADGQPLDRDRDNVHETASFPAFYDTLRELGRAQYLIIEKLLRLRREFAQWDNYHSLAGELRKLRDDQEALAQRTKEHHWDSIALQSADGGQRTILATLSGEQFDLAHRVEDVQRRMGDMRDVLAESNPAAADNIGDALHLGVRRGVRNKMQQAGDEIKNNQVGLAAGIQGQLVNDLDEIIGVLTHRNERQLKRRRTQLQAAEEELDEITRRAKQQRAELQVATSENPIRKPGQLQYTVQKIAELREQTARMSRQLERLQANRASRDMDRAAHNMQRSVDAARQGNAEQVDAPAGQAEADLAAARQQLAKALRQVEQALLDEQLAQLDQQLTGLIDRQQAAGDEIIRLDKLRIRQGSWTPGQQSSLHRSAVDESTLAEETDRLAARLEQAAVFRFGLSRIAQQMRQVVGRLDQNQTEQSTQALAAAAHDGLVRLQTALRDEDQIPDQEDTAGTSGSAGGAASPASPPINLVELKLLRMLQEDLRERTEEQERNRAGSQPISDGQRHAARQLGEEQEHLADLIFQMLEPNGPDEDFER